MENSASHTTLDANLRSSTEKAALGWDFDSMEQRMAARLAKIRRQNQGEGSEGHDSRRLPEKEHDRS